MKCPHCGKKVSSSVFRCQSCWYLTAKGSKLKRPTKSLMDFDKQEKE